MCATASSSVGVPVGLTLRLARVTVVGQRGLLAMVAAQATVGGAQAVVMIGTVVWMCLKVLGKTKMGTIGMIWTDALR